MINYEELLNQEVIDDPINDVEDGELLDEENNENEKIEIQCSFEKIKTKKKKKKSSKIKNNLNKSNCEIQDIYDGIHKKLNPKNLNQNHNSSYLHLSLINTKIFILKIKNVIFSDSNELFQKAREEKNNISIEHYNLPEIKFWHNRYYYYSKFDDGIQLDLESWYSVTPEEIAIYISKIIPENESVVDAFCGSGGNTIQFSKNCKLVYSIDIDPVKINLSRNNCNVYQCEDNIQFICSDFLSLDNIKSDWIFVSPPWGGMSYKDQNNYSLEEMITPNFKEIIKKSLEISQKVIFYLPRNIQLNEFFDIISQVINLDTYFFDVRILNSANKVKAILIIMGDNIENKVNQTDLRRMIKLSFIKIEDYQIQQLLKISSIIGIQKFLTNFYIFTNHNEIKSEKAKIIECLKFFKNEVMDEVQSKQLKEIEKHKKGTIPEKFKENQVITVYLKNKDQDLILEEYTELLNNYL